MITKQNIIADMHTHTTFSLHAFSTIKENIEAAQKIGLKYLAITDHVYCDGSNVNIKNERARIQYMGERVNRYLEGMQVINGAEFNIGQTVPYYEKLKNNIVWRPIGLHNWFIDTENITLDEVYRHFLNAAKDGHNAFVHIERELHKVEGGIHGDTIDKPLKEFFQAMVHMAKRMNVILEVNESSLETDECGTANRLRYWLALAKENRNIISLGTDAHYCDEVGQFPLVIELLNEIDYPKELILNCNEEMIKNLK